MAGDAPWDPMEGDADWGYTGYGTGDPTAHSFLDKFGDWMPYIVAGIFTAGALQSAGLLPGVSSAEAASADALAPTIPGSYATTAYAAGQFGIPGIADAAIPAIAAGTTTAAAVAASAAATGGAAADVLGVIGAITPIAGAVIHALPTPHTTPPTPITTPPAPSVFSTFTPAEWFALALVAGAFLFTEGK